MRFRNFLILFFALGLLFFTIVPATAQATITVNTTIDTNPPLNDGLCSLREAVANANNDAATHPNCAAGSGYDTIQFAIGAAGSQQTINLVFDISVNTPMILDATTQSGLAGCENISTPLIVLDGSLGGVSINGITIGPGNVGATIRGFTVNNFTRDGIEVRGNNNFIQCNFVGTDPTGTSVAGNDRVGVTTVIGATNNIIGTDGDGLNDSFEGNLISGNNWGLYLADGATSSTTVAGNIIGLDVNASLDLGNNSHGVWISNGLGNHIIGTDGDGVSDALEGNIIAGNNGNGININGSATNITVAGNIIGLNGSATSSIPNSGGILINASSNHRIGTNNNGISDALEANIIAGNTGSGITVQGANSTGNTINGNYIGTNLSNANLANSTNGIAITATGTAATTVRSNRIYYHTNTGLFLSNAADLGAQGNSEQNCFFQNTAGLNNTTGLSQFFENNWWGISTGPSGVGPGTGDTVSANVDYTPFLSIAPVGCLGQIAVTATDASAAENPLDTGQFTFDLGLVNTTGAPVTINYTITGTAANGTDYTLISATASVANGARTSTLTISPTDDLDIEGAETVIVTLTSSNHPVFEVNTTPATVTISDNDVAGITVSPTTIAITEDGATANFSISAQVNPSASVSIPVTTNGQCSVSSNPVVLAAGGTTAVVVTVTALDDLNIEGAHTCTVTVGDPTSADANFNALGDADTADVTANITDNDVASLIVSPTSIGISEGGATNFFVIAPQANPSANVSIPVTTDGECTVSSNPVVLPAGSTTPTVVTVTAVDDLDIEGAHTCAITVGDPSSADTNFNALGDADTADVTANVTDNDVAGISVSPTTIAITEGGVTANFSISAQVNPSASVSIPVTTDGECTVSSNPVVLAAGNTTAVVVTVTAVDDLDIEGAHTCAISVGDPSSADANFDALGDADTADVTANVTDNDVAGITVSPTTIAITEGGATATFSIAAQANPSASVSVPVTTDAQCTVSSNPVILAAGNTTAVVVTVTAVDDLDVEGAHTCAISVGDPTSADTNFDALADADTDNVTANITDNDVAGITVSPTTIAITEGGATATFDISANTNTTATVDVPITTDGQCLLSSAASPVPSTSLTVSLPLGSATAITVTVEAVDDSVAEGAHLCAITTGDPGSGDTNYNALVAVDVADVTANVTDNDTSGISLSNITITEGAAGLDLDVLLLSEPTGDVTITLSPDAQCTLSTTSLTFTDSAGANPWNVAQQVNVTAVDDNIAEGAHLCVISYSASSTDTNYTIASTPHNVDVLDNDTAGISLANITITEGAAGLDLDVLLLSEPTGDVTISLSPDAQCTLSTTTLTFTDSAGANPWNIAQQVNVTAVDDNIAEGAHLCVITYSASSTDANYTIASTLHDVDVVDNDTPGISLASLTITEGAAGLDLDIVLFTEPIGDVTITLSPDAQCTLSTTSLTFTDSAGANPWNVTQQVNVTAVDDNIAEGAHLCVITYSASSTDANYTIASTPHDVDVVDNDTPAVLAAPTGGSTRISEDGVSDTVDIRLATEPSGDVILSFSTNGQCTVSPTTLTFTDSAGASPWNIVQRLTLSPVDDNDIEGGHVCVISYTSSSADPDYNLLTDNLRSRVADNDSGTVEVATVQPEIGVFDPALSKLGVLLPGQTGVIGEALEWIVTVSNTGSAAGVNVSVTDTLIPALRIDRVEATGANVTITGQTVTVVYPVLNAGQTATFSIFTTVLEGATIENTACVMANNQAVEECTTGLAVRELPQTGESIWWRLPLFLMLGLAGLGTLLFMGRKLLFRH